jgi:hypothetical protein
VGRESGSLLRPWIEPPPGSAMCLACPWARYDLDDPRGEAAAHHRDSDGHPTIATPHQEYSAQERPSRSSPRSISTRIS